MVGVGLLGEGWRYGGRVRLVGKRGKFFLTPFSFFSSLLPLSPPSTPRFMENLQTEVLELEFAEFSSGLKTITEIEFAQILLRFPLQPHLVVYIQYNTIQYDKIRYDTIR